MADRQSVDPWFNAVHSFFSAFDDHDVQAMIAQCAADAQVRFVPMGQNGGGAIRTVGKIFWSSLFDAVPDVVTHMGNVFGASHNVAVEVVIEGTQRKEFEHIPNLGRHFILPHAFLFSLDQNAEIANAAIYWDNATLFSKLGKTTLDSNSPQPA